MTDYDLQHTTSGVSNPKVRRALEGLPLSHETTTAQVQALPLKQASAYPLTDAHYDAHIAA